ncbi:apolipoprotein N-acyltransferase [Phytomonospora endophytica]|uniref:Apolipoprotein N-acyltransferase n=1 Tax=Phytomonospora endophytica TaxID=714109 RepID=A0A841FIR8_9ACTN|nr:apolipoprotein N-acyltransferase [Phytomonospora endophytica]MBB6033728.1 apolipoprotein N-acyltransferase [Phytomonospora endophytica]
MEHRPEPAGAAATPHAWSLLHGTGRQRRLSWWAAVAAAVVSGAGLWLSFPPYGWWWLAPLSVAGLASAVHRRRARAGFGLGLLAGLALFVPLLDWTGTQVGAWPWLLLALSQAVFVGVLGAVSAWASGVFDRWVWVWPVGTGALWVGAEALRDRVPFGGFPWGRLAFSQADSPLLSLAWLGGAPLVTFATALAGGLLLVAVWGRWDLLRVGAGVLAACAVFGASVFVPTSTPDAGSAVVAVIQGNVPRLGLEFNAQRMAVLNNHVEATIALAERVRGTADQPDLVIWPENSSDIDPTRHPDAAAAIDRAVAAIGAPILVGALVRGEDGRSRNSGLVWPVGGAPYVGYVKRNLVPFVEQVPLRSLVEKITDKVKIAGNFAPGTEPGIVEMNGVAVGDVICYEIAFDDVVRETVDEGAQLIAVQTNNATFNNAEALQQMAMVRLRAVEHGRSALMASTVGVSGFVDADGTVHDATGFNTRAELVRRVDLGEGATPAHVLGMLPELLLSAVAAGVVGAAAALTVRRRRASRAVTEEGAV